MALFALDLKAIRQYGNHSNKEVARVTRNLNGLSVDDKAELIRTPEVQVSLMQEAVTMNLAFLEKVTTLIEAGQKSLAGDEHATKIEVTVPSQKSVEKMLFVVVREWSKEGEQERAECFQRLLGALEGHLNSARDEAASSGAARPRVLCPSAQLGRLPFEVQSRGFDCESCEEQSLLYFCSEYLRQEMADAEAHHIRPFALGTCNRVRATDNVRDISFPEVVVPASSLPRTRLANFAHMYGVAGTRGTFDAVLTNHCLDTSGNIFRYVRTVAHVVRPGGLWANFGPLAFEQGGNDEAHGHGVEISWEELKFAISHFFEIKEEAIVHSTYAENARAMMHFQFGSIFFSAVRNDKPAAGIGEQ